MWRSCQLWCVGVLGCSPIPELRWEATRAECGLAADELLPFVALFPAADGGFNQLTLPPGCAERIVRDLGGDPVALVAEIGDAPDLAVHLEEERLGVRPFTGVGSVVRSAYWLLGSDLGALDTFVDLDSPYVSAHWQASFADFSDEAELAPDAAMSQVLYDYTIARFKRTVLLPEDAPVESAAATHWPTRTLQLPTEIDLERPWEFDRTVAVADVGLLLHEAAHARFGGNRHVRCAPADAIRSCDEDLDGADGAGYAAIWAQVHAATGGAGCREATAAGAVARFGEELIRLDWVGSILGLSLPSVVLAECGVE